MTKQEELAGLYELKNDLHRLKSIKANLKQHEREAENEVMRQVQNSMPTKPRHEEVQESPQKNIFRIVVFPISLFLFAIIRSYLGIFFFGTGGAEFIFSCITTGIMLVCLFGFLYAKIEESVTSKIRTTAIVFHTLCFLASAGILGQKVKTFTVVDLVLAIAFILMYYVNKNYIERKKQAHRKHQSEVYEKTENALAEYSRQRERLKRKFTQEITSPASEWAQKKQALLQQLQACEAAVYSSTILHQSFHSDIDYIIRLMETGVADSVKEALQIKRAEDQKRESDMANFRANLEIQNMYRQEDEKRRWEEQRAQWEREQAQAERERERIDQAKRAADELERIRKELEND